MPTNHSSWRTFAAVLALGLLGLAAPAPASAQGSVNGKVTDEQGVALSGAQITLDESGKSIIERIATFLGVLFGILILSNGFHFSTNCWSPVQKIQMA